MAKRRKTRATRSYRRTFKRAARRAGVGDSAKLFQLDAMAYGAIRAPISSWFQSVVPIPMVGALGDEVAMGLANWFVAKNTSGIPKKVAMKGLVVENARAGEVLAQGLLPMASGFTGGGMFVYGQ